MNLSLVCGEDRRPSLLPMNFGLPEMLGTSGNNSKHKKGSKPLQHEALDFRTKRLSKTQKHALTESVQARLGSDYDVILESESKLNEHLHVEHDGR